MRTTVNTINREKERKMKPRNSRFSNKQPVRVTGLRVAVKDGRVDKALKTLNKKVQGAGLLKEIRERQEYKKPSEKRKRAKELAKKRWHKKQAENALPKKR